MPARTATLHLPVPRHKWVHAKLQLHGSSLNDYL